MHSQALMVYNPPITIWEFIKQQAEKHSWQSASTQYKTNSLVNKLDLHTWSKETTAREHPSRTYTQSEDDYLDVTVGGFNPQGLYRRSEDPITYGHIGADGKRSVGDLRKF
ncbi:MAG: hypothetical protein JSR58_02350 [Verrucomicrobia bacterium]|nr:hypothetical protein [Verrucomicrobiota bacterium]